MKNISTMKKIVLTIGYLTCVLQTLRTRLAHVRAMSTAISCFCHSLVGLRTHSHSCVRSFPHTPTGAVARISTGEWLKPNIFAVEFPNSSIITIGGVRRNRRAELVVILLHLINIDTFSQHGCNLCSTLGFCHSPVDNGAHSCTCARTLSYARTHSCTCTRTLSYARTHSCMCCMHTYWRNNNKQFNSMLLKWI